VKARAGGAAYVYSICSGFQTPPAGFKVLANKYYNPYFDGWNISMPPPLADNPSPIPTARRRRSIRNAHDVATFLSWTAEPKMEERKHLGFEVMAFLLLLSGLLFLSYRRIWRDALIARVSRDTRTGPLFHELAHGHENRSRRHRRQRRLRHRGPRACALGARVSPWGEPSDALLFGRWPASTCCSCRATAAAMSIRRPRSTTAPISTR
jgi:hypothetical protein